MEELKILDEIEVINFEIGTYVKHLKQFPQSEYFNKVRSLQQERRELLKVLGYVRKGQIV